MNNKAEPNWFGKAVSIGMVVSIPLFWLTHDCEIAKAIKTDTQIGIPISNNDTGCGHKIFVAGLTNTVTPSGDFIDCPVDVWINY